VYQAKTRGMNYVSLSARAKELQCTCNVKNRTKRETNLIAIVLQPRTTPILFLLRCYHPPRHKSCIGVARGWHPPKCFAYPIILCFEKRCPKQHTVARLKSNILPLPKFGASYVTEIMSYA